MSKVQKEKEKDSPAKSCPPLIIPNKYLTSLLFDKEKEQLCQINQNLTKKITKRVCPSLLEIATISGCKVTPTNQILYGTSLCFDLNGLALAGIDSKTIKQLSTNFKITWPWSLTYDSERLGSNKRFVRFPAMIIYPRNECEVSAIVRFSVRQNLTLSVRSGGHSYEYFSGENQVILDTSYLELPRENSCSCSCSHSGDCKCSQRTKTLLRSQIKIDLKTQTVEVSAGVRLGVLYAELDKQGFILSAGICPSVCIAGLVAGGGLGFFDRAFGFACDSLISVRICIANGQILTTSLTEFPDLFQSLHGAGSSYGVLMSFVLQIRRIPKVISFNLNYDIKDAVSFLVLYQSFIQTATEKLSGIIANFGLGLPFFFVNGVYIGPIEEIRKLIFDTFGSIPLQSSTFEEKSFLDIDKALGFEALPLPFYKIRSNAFFSNLSTQDWTAFVNLLSTPPPKFPHQISAIQVVAYGGAMKRIRIGTGPGSSVIAERFGIGLFQSAIYWDNQDLNVSSINFLDTVYQTIRSVTSDIADPNIVDLQLVDYPKSYWGDAVAFLKATKLKYDPNDVFHFSQSVPLSE